MTSDRKPLLAGFMPWLGSRQRPQGAPADIAVAVRPKGEPNPMNEHIVKSYEEELALLDRKIAQMGGLAEHILGQSFDAL
jgi:phosphate transport system protein